MSWPPIVLRQIVIRTAGFPTVTTLMSGLNVTTDLHA